MKPLYLNDPAIEGEAQIWYAKPDMFEHTIFGAAGLARNGISITKASLSDTHVLLGSVKIDDLEQIFTTMQGEVWSPNGEARGLIRGKGLQHTSMSVGDVIVRPGVDGGTAFLVDRMGFVQLADAPDSSARADSARRVARPA